MNQEDKSDTLKYYIDAVYEHLKHSELRERLPRNADEDRIAHEIAGEVLEFVQGRFDARLDVIEQEAYGSYHDKFNSKMRCDDEFAEMYR